MIICWFSISPYIHYFIPTTIHCLLWCWDFSLYQLFNGTSILRIGLLQKKTYWNHTCCIRNSSSRFMLFYEIYYIFCIWLRPTCTICNLSWPQCCSPFCLQKNKSFIKSLPKSSHLVVVWLKSTVHTHVFQKNQRKSKGIGCLLLFMAPLALCTSMSQPGDAVAHGRAHEGNWQKRFRQPQAPHRHPMDVWKLMARLVRWQQKSLPTKNLPNLISKGLVFYFQQEGDEIPNLDSPW